jgi:hypothetical protein
MRVETIKVKAENEQGFIVKNKSDFDEKNDVEFKGEKPKGRPKKDK